MSDKDPRLWSQMSEKLKKDENQNENEIWDNLF